MEFVIVLWALYVAQCVVWVPAGVFWFVRPPGGWIAVAGPGWRMLHLLPSGTALRGSRFPLFERDGRLLGLGDASWWTSRGAGSGAFATSLHDLARARVRGARIELGGRELTRAASAQAAEALAASLRGIAAGDATTQRTRVAEALRAGHSRTELSERRVQFEQATRWLGRCSDAYFFGLLVLLPVAIVAVGAEFALGVAFLPLGALHVCVLLLLARAHRRLGPGQAAGLVESLMAAALYPPLLLRGRHDLATSQLAGFHPAAVAALILDDEARERTLRSEFLAAARRCEEAATAGASLGIATEELEALRRLVKEIGVSEARLLAPPARSDPRSVAYCPDCRSEFRRAHGECSVCHLPLAPLPDADGLA